VEITYFDRGPVDAKDLILAGYWSTYWYNGRIYGTEIARGLDVFALLPSAYLSAAEIAAAALAEQGGVFNPQQQFPVRWPAVPVVALAYVDQLQRSGRIPESQVANLLEILDRAGTVLSSGTSDPQLATELLSLASALEVPGDDATENQRRVALAETLAGIARVLQDD
jgi:hypothetical protein